MSAHHYFRDFAYCDSGMIPWLTVLQILCESGKRLSALVGERIAKFPSSGEINRRVPDGKAAIAAVQRRYESAAQSLDFTDGLSVDLGDWRFNLRGSNTEPLIRLNVETRGDSVLLRDKTQELLEVLDSLGAVAADH
jgi:phosphomannomutase